MHPNECPTREELSAYLVGKLRKERLEAVADHVESCPICQSALQPLEAGRDSLIPLLRQRPVVDPTRNPELQRLMSLVKPLGVQQTPLAETPQPLPAAEGEPKQLGQYQLLKKIGAGGMGEVYKARHCVLGKVFALKTLPLKEMKDARDFERFMQEILAGGKLIHHNIIQATDAGVADGVPYLVMEFVEGTDLHKLVKRQGPLPVPEACELIRQAAQGLQHAHKCQLVHRDVKPSNLLLSRDGQVKLLDMGLARFHSQNELTAENQLLGTLDYIAPEQARDARSVDIRADIYSLGCTLYHLLAGQPPFSGPKYQSQTAKLIGHSQDSPPSIQDYRPGVPAPLAALLHQMLAKNPADRPATPRAVAEALAPFTTGCNLSCLIDPPASSSGVAPGEAEPLLLDTRSSKARADTHSSKRILTPSRKRRPHFKVVTILAGGVLLLAGLTGVAFWVFSARDDSPQARSPSDVARPDSASASEQLQDKDPGNQASQKKEEEKTEAEKPAEKEPRKENPPEKAEPIGNLAEQGTEVLKKYCYRCHGVDFKVPRFNVMDRSILVARPAKEELPYVTVGKPEQSQIWQRAGVDEDMPPGAKKPTEAEKELLKQWIVAGAPFPGRPTRPFRSEKDILTAIRDHLRKTAAADRRFQRYFSLTHLSNNHYHVSADELRLYRAALAKVVNSLSWKQAIVVPKAIDGEESLFNIDLRDLGWDENQLWKEIIKVYPYGLEHTNDQDRGLRDLAGELVELAGNDLLLLRADWFIATATRPPLYHTLLRLPKDAGELEQHLKVDVRRDFDRNKLARAGFLTSGVSRQNRLVDRHDAVYGAYWKSYDFKHNEGRGNLVQCPLGPDFPDHPFQNQAFQHDGGEIIFNLPNGLQGYLLIDGKDKRIDAGPIEVVRDSQETAGTPVIVNGLSCMACHKHGVIRFEDKIREGSAVAGQARIKVEDLFRTRVEMDRMLDKDEDRFLRALEEATGAFLKTGEDRNKKIRDFPEPVGAIARLYVKDLSLEEVALELGIDDPKKLKSLIEVNPMLRRLGLGSLLNGGAIKRDLWSSLEFTTSLFQNVAKELGLGTPLVPF